MKPKTRFRTYWMIAPVVLFLFLTTSRFLFPGRPFDPVVWHAIIDPNDSTRRDMADRLIARRTLIGKSREEIARMLGSPTDSVDDRIRFVLGPERGFVGLDSEYMVLIFSSHGVVVRAFTEHD
jgi:hypothetical protein